MARKERSEKVPAVAGVTSDKPQLYEREDRTHGQADRLRRGGTAWT